MSSWRDAAKARISTIYVQVWAFITEGEIDKARSTVFDAYPFGQRHYTPYKVWCEEVRRAFPPLSKKRQSLKTPAVQTASGEPLPF